jgi:hypothetical protein
VYGTHFAAWEQPEFSEEHSDVATTSLIDYWIDQTERRP